ncbi:hypothetical protein ELP00_14785 [Salmonella enterica subsp. enterica serovar Kiambu]|nr:hypothetical protein [Salmonella enterica subsp. enterica serovar Kiambu]
MNIQRFKPVAHAAIQLSESGEYVKYKDYVALEERCAALLDEVESAEHTSAVDHEAACSLVEENEELKRLITEMESKNSNLRTIAHEQNELAIRVNLDSINDAVEMDRLHKRIAELEAREVILPQRLQPGADGYDDWYVHSADDGEYLKADDVIEAIRAAGIKVKES